jgi:hypothetical protein
MSALLSIRPDAAADDDELTEIAENIRAEVGVANAELRSSTGHAMRVGGLLVRAKTMVAHGRWLSWLKNNCSLNERSAQRFMSLYRKYGSNPACVSDLSLRAVLRLLPDKPARDTVEAIVGLTDANDTPQPLAHPISRSHDLWICGAHRILCGDATQMEDVERVLNGNSADMSFNDPPYNVGYTGKTSRKLTLLNDDLGSDFYEFLFKACTNILKLTNGAVYICMSSSEVHTLRLAFDNAGGHWSDYMIWLKCACPLG